MIKSMVPFTQPQPGEQPRQLPAWMSGLCGHVVGAVEGKLGKIVEAQVKKAEKGDTAATQFVLELYSQSQAVLSQAAIPTIANPSPGGEFLGEEEFSVLCALNDAGGPLSIDELAPSAGGPRKASAAVRLLVSRGLASEDDGSFMITTIGSEQLNRKS